MFEIKKIFILIAFTLSSCFGRIEDKIEQLFDNHEFNSNVNNCNIISIRLKKPNTSEVSMKDSSFYTTNIYTIKDGNKILMLKDIIDKSEMTGYCCCPETNFSLSFLKNKEILNTYYIDTVQFKDNVRIFEGSFQYSYIVKKEKWDRYLGMNTKSNASSKYR